MVVATAGMQAGTTISISVSIGCGLCGIGRPLSHPIRPAKINISNLHYRHHINMNKNTNFLLVRCSSSSSGGSGRQPGRGFGSQQPSSSSSPDKSKKRQLQQIARLAHHSRGNQTLSNRDL